MGEVLVNTGKRKAPDSNLSCCKEDQVSTQGGLNVLEAGGQRSNKRKSPCVSMPIIKSPLSRMLLSPRVCLSPRMYLSPRLHLSPAYSDVTSRSDIDLNVEPEEVNLDLTIGFNHGQDTEAAQDENAPHAQGLARRNVIHDDKRRAIFEALLSRARNGTLKGHETTEVSLDFYVPIRTVQRIWKKGKRCLDQGILVDVSTEKSKCGRKKIEVDVSKVRNLPISSRSTLDSLSKELGVSKSKLHAMKREGTIQRVSNSIKPFLTEKNKERLKWCVSMLDPRSVPHDPVFKDLFDFVFIDEKWFYLTRSTERYYKTLDEEQPTRTCKSKKFIPKIMFLTAIARPRYDSNGNCIFDGKIGCFPFVIHVAAKRSSVNRKAGTMEMKPMDSVKREVIRQFLIDKVLLAIRAKWPREDAHKPIYIQQDNAPSHVAATDKLFCEAAKLGGFDIRLVCQPPNSPDFNILDLGFFNLIQSIQYKTTTKTTAELVAAVDKAFQDYSPCKGNRIFLTLHGCMKEAMRIGGGNGYDIPHIRKEMLERQGRLPLQLNCDATLVQEAIAKIKE